MFSLLHKILYLVSWTLSHITALLGDRLGFRDSSKLEVKKEEVKVLVTGDEGFDYFAP